ncbi:RpiB/LacA/LacB family sugar-phosphate isomerase [Amedibacillus sp. YH-ame6]
MKIVIGCDEAAYKLKETLKSYLIEAGNSIEDVGVFNEEPAMYPDIANSVCQKICDQTCERGLLLCGTGIGMAITANKVPGIRAAVGHDLFSVERSVRSNDCQILCMGARVIAPEYAKLLLDRWLTCNFDGGKSTSKVERIMEIEKNYR